MKKTNKKKLVFYLLNVLIIIAVTGLTVSKIIEENGIQTFSHLKGLSLISIFVLISMFFVNYFFDGLIISLSIGEYEDNIGLGRGFVGQCVGGLFSGITPLKMGYFPGLAYVYSKFNVKGENMIKAMAKTGFSNQMLMLLISVITFVACCFNPITIIIGNVSLNFVFVSLIGVIYNAVLMIGYFLLVLSPGLHNFILKIISFIFAKLRIVSDRNTYYEEKKKKMELTRNEIRKYLKNFKQSSIIFVLFLIKNLIYLGMPYVVYLLLTNGTLQLHMWLYTIVLWNLITCITNVIPIPGASGAAETIFIAVFSLAFKPVDIINSVMLVWRLFSYFINIMVGFVVFAVLMNVKIKKKDKPFIQ